jgi:hypothetical protein
MSHLSATLGATALLLVATGCAEACDASFARDATIGNQRLVLNGQGWRVVSPWGIKAYAAALYQPVPTRDRDVALQAGRPWMVEMVYCRSAPSGAIGEVWAAALRQNCWRDCGLTEQAIRQFLTTLDDARPASRWSFGFDGIRLEVREGGIVRGAIADPVFARVLLATWIGPVPPTAELAAALLGGR